MNQLGRMYSIDLTTTGACNFNCDYCFEHIDSHGGIFLDKNYELLFRRIDELLESDFFKKNYNLLGLNFWGGEPTLNPKFITNCFEQYKNDDRIRFMLYTNGSNFDVIFDIADSVKNVLVSGHPKFVIQVSYDGQPVHDIYRTKKDGSLTSSYVRDRILSLEKADIPYSIKATITVEAFKYLSYCYEDIVEIFNIGRMDKWKNNTFFPTVDYYHISQYDDDVFERCLGELKKALVSIASKDIDFYKKFNRFFFAWFNQNKAICSAGKDLVVIDVDGKVYKCHGCLYTDLKNDHYITSIEDDNFVDKLVDSFKLHSPLMHILPPRCRTCTTPYCLKCNAAKYDKSVKPNYTDKWIHYDVEPRLCRVFKVNESVVLAIKEILK